VRIHQFVLIAPPIPSTVPINKAVESDCGVGRILPECNVLANIPITEPHAKPAAAPWNLRPQLMGCSCRLRDIGEVYQAYLTTYDGQSFDVNLHLNERFR